MQVSTCWTEAADEYVHSSFRDKLALAVIDEYVNDSVVSDTLRNYVTSGDVVGLLNFRPDYAVVSDLFTLVGWRQVLALFQKDESLVVPGYDRLTTAVDKWKAAELHCAMYNAFHRKKIASNGVLGFDEFQDKVFLEARSLLARWFPRHPGYGNLKYRFGPGATTEVKKSMATWQMKLAEKPACGLALYASQMLPTYLRELPHYLEAHRTDEYISDGWLCDSIDFTISSGRVTGVPKSFDEVRLIDVQPTFNTLIQSGWGDWMSKQLLKNAGLDLRDQSASQRFARLGSMGSPISTIDLSSASDTIGTVLVKYLLPGWLYNDLAAVRVGSTVLPDGTEVTLEKFCSMGNGFTFPLESAIFYALVLAVHILHNKPTEHCRVFGDDITCHSDVYDDVCGVLVAAGFKVNTKKSYATGPFREACGADYYKGFDIRPYYLKNRISGEVLFSCHNFFQRRGMTRLATLVRSFIPTSLRLYGPDGYGDGHLVSFTWQSQKRRREIACGYEGTYFDSYTKNGIRIPSVFPGDWVTPLYTVYMKPCTDDPDQATEMEFLPNGRPLYPAPGWEGYSRKSIYTFLRQ